MAAKSTGTVDQPTAREKLLAAANELFYQEGVHTVGIDRVIERAGVAKATLYSTYGSKDELIRAYLEGRYRSRKERTTRLVAERSAPRERLLAVFDALEESLASPGYRGCAFANASAEAKRGGPIQEVTDEIRGWLRGLLADLARAAGAAEPERLAAQLHMLYDGASASARMDRNLGAAAVARQAAETLIDVELARADPEGR